MKFLSFVFTLLLIAAITLSTGCADFFKKDLQQLSGDDSDFEFPPGALPIGFVNAQQAADTFSKISNIGYFPGPFSNDPIYLNSFLIVQDTLPKFGDARELSNPNPIFAYQFLANSFCQSMISHESGLAINNSGRVFFRDIELSGTGLSTPSADIRLFIDRFARRAWGYTNSEEAAIAQEFAEESRGDFAQRTSLYLALCDLLMSTTSTLVH